MKKLAPILIFTTSITLINGCTSLGVEPWQRDVLAKPEMSLSYDQIDISLDEHVYFSKEGTSGGRSFAGGGCGCN
jgi:hypothetical protein